MSDSRNDWRWTKERVGALRDMLNRSQHEMAVLVGVSERTIFRWEKGLAQPRRKAARRLAEVEQKLTARISKEQERRAFNEYLNNTLKVHEMRAAIRETAKALAESWKLLRQTKETLHRK